MSEYEERDLTARPLAGRIAIVTGASRERGIGAAVCRALADKGADICFTTWRRYDDEMPWGSERDFESVLADELRAQGVRAHSLEIDLTHDDAPTALIDEVRRELGAPSILVNNATYSTSDGLEAFDGPTLDAHYRVNMRGTMLLSVAFARQFTLGSGGRIVNLTSGQSRGPMRTELAYGATKGAIEAFTLSFAAEVARLGITVNAVNPGPTDTGWMPDDLKEFLRPRFPFGRIGEPDDAARLIAFLATDDARWITGQVIHSEGGFER